MIINNQPQNSSRRNFGNLAVDSTMNYLATNKAIGATAVDMGSMVIPRTAIDYTRSSSAGNETLRRELSSCFLYVFVGAIGVGAGCLIAPFAKAQKYGVKLHKINAGSEEIDTFSKVWNNSLSKNNYKFDKNKKSVVKNYFEEIFSSTKGLNGNTKIGFESNPELKKEIIDDMTELLSTGNNYKIPQNKKKLLVQKITTATGSNENLFLTQGKKTLKIKAEDLLDHSYSLGQGFMQPKVVEEFRQSKTIQTNKFVKSLKSFTMNKMLLGLGVISLIAGATQAVNRYLTKKKTGTDAFIVSKDGRIPKKNCNKKSKFAFNTMKVAATAAMMGFAASTIGKLKDIPKKLQFTGLNPNINQYKYIYGITIAGRLMAARDKNELRETATRDFLGFTSWLILGDVAARATASVLEKKKGVTLLNTFNPANKGIKRVLNSSLKNHEELLYANKDNIGKTFSQAAKGASELTKKSMKCLNIAQLSGYLCSGVLLGIIIPLLNKFTTDRMTTKNAMKNKS